MQLCFYHVIPSHDIFSVTEKSSRFTTICYKVTSITNVVSKPSTKTHLVLKRGIVGGFRKFVLTETAMCTSGTTLAPDGHLYSRKYFPSNETHTQNPSFVAYFIK